MTERDRAIQHPDVAFRDDRGEIIDLVQGERLDAATMITSRAGAVRGNHWHAETIQYIYVLSGSMLFTVQLPGEERRTFTAGPGDLVVNELGERHAMRALEETVFLVLTRGPRGGSDYESDTYRLPPDEWLDHG